jgi:hypothetical protein
MKNLITIVIAILTFSNLNAQIYNHLSTEGIEEPGSSEYGVYYKDVNNVFDDFTGTYEYSGNDFYFKIILIRKNHSNMSNYYWEDIIVGGYQYTKNGVDINYLNVNPDAIVNGKNGSKIWLSSIRTPDSNFCDDCPSGKSLVGAIFDPIRHKSGTLHMARKTQNGETGLQIWILLSASVKEAWESDEPIQLPTGIFFMKKIN